MVDEFTILSYPTLSPQNPLDDAPHPHHPTQKVSPVSVILNSQLLGEGGTIETYIEQCSCDNGLLTDE